MATIEVRFRPRRGRNRNGEIDHFCRGNFGPERARQLLQETVIAANEIGVPVGELTQTAYVNSIHQMINHSIPGICTSSETMMCSMECNDDGHAWEQIFRGHWWTHFDPCEYIHLWEVGLNHFFRGKDGLGNGDHVYWQGHASPILYAGLDGRTNG